MEGETFVTELCHILLKHGMIPEKEIAPLQKAFKESDQENFDEFLLDEGLIEPEDLLRALSLHYKVPSMDVRGIFFERPLVRMFPKEFLERNIVIPYEVDENILFVVASRPESMGLESAMRDFVSYDIEFLVGLSADIIDAIDEFYDKSPSLDVEEEDRDMDEEDRVKKESKNKEEDLESLGYSEVIYNDEGEEE